jgi:glycerophosphoryl diester phosphodiesterase
MALLLGHRGYSSKHLENSLEAFRAALAAGMDGFELDVQPTLDGACIILHDDDLARTAQAAGRVRNLRLDELPLLKNGERVPLLSEALALPALLVNVELKGSPGWEIALAEVKRADALSRVLFSSFEHDEIFALHAACSSARCGLLYTTEETLRLTGEAIARLPSGFTLNLPLSGVQARTDFWVSRRRRIVLWGMKSAGEARSLPFEPAVIVSDGR